MQPKRGDIFYADLSPVVGSEQGGIRPVLIIQNDMGNRYSPTIICAAMTNSKGKLITHYKIKGFGTVQLEQIRTIDKTRLHKKIGSANRQQMDRVNIILKKSLGIF